MTSMIARGAGIVFTQKVVDNFAFEERSSRRSSIPFSVGV